MCKTSYLKCKNGYFMASYESVRGIESKQRSHTHVKYQNNIPWKNAKNKNRARAGSEGTDISEEFTCKARINTKIKITQKKSKRY